MSNFQSFNLPTLLNEALVSLSYQTPTPIQAQAIPVALEGHDILGSAQTGTGKTAAFGIPLIAQLMSQPHGSALVLTPTRELALQVMKMLRSLLGNAKINTALLIGGEPIFKQFKELKAKPRLIVATPGRLNDHLQRRSVRLNDVGFLVLDETDRMLDMGFSIQIDEIVAHLPESRQTLLFSATLPKNIIRMADKYMKSPIRIAVGTTTAAAEGIKQEMIKVSESDKYSTLLSELEKRDGTVIVFVKTKFSAEKMANLLRKEKHAADAIHGDLRQRQRERVIRSFRERKYRIMVATDIAARGLDISHVKHVINYDLPQCPEDYIHRIGRTARAGAEGSALSFVTQSERHKWQAIDKMMNPEAYKNQQKDKEGRNSKSKSRFKKGKPFSNSNSSSQSNEQRKKRRFKSADSRSSS